MPAAYHDPSFIQEVWGLFAGGSAVLLARLAVRARTVGIRQFCADDYISIVVLLCYIGDAVTVDLTYRFGSNVDFTQPELIAMSESDLHEVITGSKLQMLAWYSYTALIWALKFCMLSFFARLTSGLSMQTYVRYLSVAMIVSYLAVFLTITCGCLPVHKNWQAVPDPGTHCTLRPQNLYVTSAANVLTDALILITPIPMLWNLRVTRGRKLGLTLLLFPGVFVIAAALIRVIMSLQARPSALNINRWGVRETLAGIIAVNMPILRPLLLKAFWTPGSMPSDQANSHKSHLASRSNPRKWTLSSASAISRRGQQHLGSSSEPQHDIEVQNKSNAVIELSDRSSECSNHSGADSDEFIFQRPRGLSQNKHSGKDEILIETSFGSTVEYRQNEYRPAAHGGVPQEDRNFITSVTHGPERKS